MLHREDVLLVDGYNMIGAWPELAELKQDELEQARDRLLSMLADYQGYAGLKIIVVFDAFRVPGQGAKYKHLKMKIVFTRERETADECIERLVGEMASVKRNLYVATSDLVEQHVAFGRGALRLSARELRLEVLQSRTAIQTAIRQEQAIKRNPLSGVLSEDVRKQLERMRRGDMDSQRSDGKKR